MLLEGVRFKTKAVIARVKGYVKRLMFPLWLFPVKLVTYSAFYLLRMVVRMVVEIIRMVVDTIIFPFRSLRNLVKSVLIVGLMIYVGASLFVIVDYLRSHYGYLDKFLCAYGTQDRLRNSVVRIVGGYSEGTGFFIEEDQVLTNFHVIADEPSPKIILPDGSFVTPEGVTGNRDGDLAVLTIREKHPEMVLPLPENIGLVEEEPLLAAGYPMGTDLSGRATVMKGNFADYRAGSGLIQTNISLVPGMSGGPLTDQCGQVVGINTMGVAGLSLFIRADMVAEVREDSFSDKEIKKIEVDPAKSPEAAVEAFYTYLKARRMEEGFKLLSKEYLQKTNFEEWTSRFKDVLDVTVYISERYKKTEDTAFVKFSTKNWVGGEAEEHYYQGTWVTVKEEGVYKMRKSKIEEVEGPDDRWFWTGAEE